VHGLGSSQNYYGAIIPAFVKENFRCIAFDTTGSGRSPSIYTSATQTIVSQDIAKYSADVIAILDGLNVQKAVVAGHSMGGIVTAHLAIKYPNRIVASIWIGPVYPSPQLAEVFEGRIKTVREKGMEALADTIPTAATSANASSLSRAMIRELLLAQTADGYINNCNVIATAEVPIYEEIGCPVLLIAGDEDKSASLEGCKKMFERVKVEEKRMVVLNGVGHWHCLEVCCSMKPPSDRVAILTAVYRLLRL
jgi:pimeloyl-ACP methyl ester carboxylesterase